MRIAVDAMGGDHAPREIVAGAIEALKSLKPTDQLVLIGQEDRVQAELEKAGYNGNDGLVTVVHASQVVSMGDNPVKALKQKRDSSLAKMVELASNREVDVFISAGNTGACVAACQVRLRTLKGVVRPGIAVVIPSFGGPVVLCDVGANISPKPVHMQQYAFMSAIYAEQMLGISNPKVALLSIGEEDAKGNSLVKEVRYLLKSDPRVNFIGYVEGRSLLEGAANVVICDGFVGNVALKLIEGLADGLLQMLRKSAGSVDPLLRTAFEPVLEKLSTQLDYSEYGGAPLLGVDGMCYICHGSSNRRAIEIAVIVASKQNNINEQIVKFMNDEPAPSPAK